MKNFRFIYFIIILYSLIGCTNSEESLLITDDNSNIGEEVILLRERDKNHPCIDYSNIHPKHTTTRADLTISDFVGRGFKMEYYPFENAQNVGFPVIDMAKYITDKPDFYQSSPVKESYSKYESFSGYERYETKINKVSTVSTGFSLDFKIFQIGAKKTTKTIFKCTDTQLNQNVFGELAIKFYDRKFQLLIPVSTREDIYRNYLHKDFLDQLYYTTPDEVIKYYGGFVLTQFLSGGQATALYCGEYIENSHDEDNQKETNLNAEISASIDIKKKGQTRSNNGIPYQSILIGREPGSSMSITNKFQNIKFSLRTLGGLPAYSQFTVPKDINSLVFDISTWSRSLENSSNLTIAELTEESLIPISDLIEEDNLKQAFYTYYQKGINREVAYMQEPHIKLRLIFYNQQISVWETCLVTRYGEHVRLRTATISPNQSGSYLYEEADRVSILFPGLKVVGIPSYYKPGGSNNAYLVDNQNRFSINGMTKFTDTKTGKIYLLTTVPETGEKLAYTLYDSNVINDYIFAPLINSLPINNNVTLKSIRKQYYLIAL
jgi:hypothetical protein